MFGMHPSKLSKILWEVSVHAYNKLHHFITTFRADLMEDRAAVYEKYIEDAGGALNTCKGFMDGTKIRITHPTGLSVLKSFC